MSPWVLATLLLVMAFATYFQTVTGFGLSIIVIGITSAFDLVPLQLAASVVSLVSLLNCALALPPRKLRDVDWPAARAVLAGAIPASIGGVMLLGYLSREWAQGLQLLLGLVIIASGILFALRPTPLLQRSSAGRFGMSGMVAGVCGGLFGMPGPPVIFLLYRQPLALSTVRNLLLVVFLFISLTRMVYLGLNEGFDRSSYLIAFLSLPLIAVMTWIGHRFPPPLSPATMRRFTFGVLVLIGVSLVVPVM